VAVLGSILAQAYRNQLDPHLGPLPAAARNAATSSITASQAVAAKLGPAGRQLSEFADAAFVHAMHLTTLFSAAITLLGALVVMRWMPGRAAARTALPAPAAGQAVPASEPVPAGEPVRVSEPVRAGEPVRSSEPGSSGAAVLAEAAPLAAPVAADAAGGPVMLED
jgi:hypothetical protein